MTGEAIQRFRAFQALTVCALALLTLSTAVPASALAGAISQDLSAIASPRTLEILAAGTVLTLAARSWDNPDAAERLLGRGSIDNLSDFGNLYGSGVTLAAATGGILGAGALAHSREWRRAGGEMTRSLLYTGVVVTTLKVAFHRTRPNGGPYSFPSGHTAAAFSVAPILARRFGLHAALPAYLFAIGTGMGRMEDRKHYLSDVVFGAAVGTAIGLSVATGDENQPRSWGLSVQPRGIALSTQF